jgi:elongation factor Ts
MIAIEVIKQLRDETGAGVLDVKKALEKFAGDIEQAKKELMEKGAIRAAKKQEERTANDGLVYAYIHGAGKVGSLVCIACETDFVAKTDEFQKLCKEIAMQVSSEKYNDIEELLNSEYIRDPSKKISDLITEVVAKVGEKIQIKNFCRMSVTE